MVRPSPLWVAPSPRQRWELYRAGESKQAGSSDTFISFWSALVVLWAAALTSSEWGNVTWDWDPKKLFSPLLKCFDQSVVSQQEKLNWKHLFWYKYLFPRVLPIFSSLLEMKRHRAYEASSLPLSCTSSSDTVVVRTLLNQRILKTRLFLLMHLLQLPRRYSLLGSVDISCKLASPVCLAISFQTFRSAFCRWSTHEWMELNVEDIMLIWKANHSIR